MKFIHLLLCIFLNFSRTNQVEQTCEVTNIHVTNEDGREQIFRVKHLEQDWFKTSCDSCREVVEGEIRQHQFTKKWQPPMRFSVGEIVDCGGSQKDKPYGLCREKTIGQPGEEQSSVASTVNMELIQEHADVIVQRGLVPLASGHEEIDRKIAYGLVLMNTGYHEEAILHFTSLIQEHPDLVAGYIGRGSVYARRGVKDLTNQEYAMDDFNKAISMDSSTADGYERRAELHIPQGRYKEALADIDIALGLKSSGRLYYIRGIVMVALQELAEAEQSFRNAVKMEDGSKLLALFQLAITMQNRGKVRNAIEVYKDILDINENHVDTHLGLGQAYRELGNFKQSEKSINKALEIEPTYIAAWQLRGHLFYEAGDIPKAIEAFQQCLSVEPQVLACDYMLGLCSMAQGRYYPAVKSHTKVMVFGATKSMMSVTPEFLKAHYLREYSRYLHTKLDSPLDELDPDSQLSTDFKSHWIYRQPFSFKGQYKEQPGLQPHISDVVQPSLNNYPPGLHDLICYAYKIGHMTKVNADGYLPNKRVQFTMGLAAVHIAQLLEVTFKDWKNNKVNASVPQWRTLFNTVVTYLRLADPENAIFWLDQIPADILRKAQPPHNLIYLLRQHITNIQVTSYYELVFKLMKTMVQHFTTEDMADPGQLEEEVEKANNCHDLLKVLKSELKQPEFMVSTQVPSQEDPFNRRHEGFIFTLAEDLRGQPLLSIHVATSPGRTTTYHQEMDYVLEEFYSALKKSTVNNIVDVDYLINLILSLVYYFHNLMPLSQGTSVVATTVAVGLLLSIGKEATSPLPHGKLWEMEAILSGAPETFQLVTKNWMTLKKPSIELSSIPLVSEMVPTVRSVIEILNVASSSTC